LTPGNAGRMIRFPSFTLASTAGAHSVTPSGWRPGLWAKLPIIPLNIRSIWLYMSQHPRNGLSPLTLCVSFPFVAFTANVSSVPPRASSSIFYTHQGHLKGIMSDGKAAEKPFLHLARSFLLLFKQEAYRVEGLGRMSGSRRGTWRVACKRTFRRLLIISIGEVDLAPPGPTQGSPPCRI
jgi:hypothetical protein